MDIISEFRLENSNNTTKTSEGKATQSRLNKKHFTELTQKRGLDPRWIEANCISVNAKTATEHLGYPAKSEGILLQGHGYQEQFKPDKPWKSDDGKAPKYRSCKDEDGYDAMLPRHPDNPRFWDDLEALKQHCYQIDGFPCLVVTEGFFKAIAATSHGIPTIALLGVEMGLTSAKRDPQGKRYLTPTLEKFARADLGVAFAYDADAATKKDVNLAQLKLAYQLKKFGIPVYSVTGLWKDEDVIVNEITGQTVRTKGIDDYIQAHGADKFKMEILAKAQTLEQWEQQFKEEVNTGTDKPDANALAREIAEEYQPAWRFCDTLGTWRVWTGKVWKNVSVNYIQSRLQLILETRNIKHNGSSFIDNLYKLTKLKLSVFDEWKTFNKGQYIPFNNGVLEVATGKLLPHSPGFGFTTVSPYEYRPIGRYTSVIEALQKECPTVYRFFNHAVKGNEPSLHKLLAIVNAIVTWKLRPLQHFIHIAGKPGTGKGTFLRLLQKCVGEDNYRESSIEFLNSEYELADIIHKQLVTCSDESEKVKRKTILKLTGSDDIHFRQIYQQGGSAPFYGALVIASNTPIFAGDTTGIKRRLCFVSFDNPVPKTERNSKIEDLMDTEIAQLVAVSLTLKDDEVKQTILGLSDAEVPENKLHEWRLTIEANSVAAFFNEHIIVDPQASVYSGELYTAYKRFCEDGGMNALSMKTFPRQFDELTDDLEIKSHWEKPAGRKAFFSGVRLRRAEEIDNYPPTWEQQLQEQVKPPATHSSTDALPIALPIEAPLYKDCDPLLPIEGEPSFIERVCEPVQILSETAPPHSQAKKELEFVQKLQNKEELTAQESQAVKLIEKGVAQVCGYKTSEELLKDWEQLNPYQKRCLELAINGHKDGEKFLTKTLPRLRINPTELGLSDLNRKVSESDGDQMSLF